MDTKDIAKLTKAQQDVLGQIAIGFDGGHSTRVIKALLAKGLIEAEEQQTYGSGNSPIDRIPITVARYFVPWPVHLAWAQWCSEQGEEKDA